MFRVVNQDGGPSLVKSFGRGFRSTKKGHSQEGQSHEGETGCDAGGITVEGELGLL